MRRRSVVLLPLLLGPWALTACSVQAGKVPAAAIDQPPEVAVKTRGEVKSTLGELYSSVAVMGRVQSVLQRGLAEKDLATGDPVPANLLAPSDADSLTFDAERPERFEYRLNNSERLSLTTRAGGKITVVLAGSLDDTGPRLAIKDAKLEVIHEKPAANQVFHIVYEKHTDIAGSQSTDWSIDFRQLSDLYRAMGGDDEAVASLDGALELRLSSTEAHVTAKDLVIARSNLKVVLEDVEIDLAKRPVDDQVKVKGHVDQGGSRRGDFSVTRATSPSSTEFALDLNLE